MAHIQPLAAGIGVNDDASLFFNRADEDQTATAQKDIAMDRLPGEINFLKYFWSATRLFIVAVGLISGGCLFSILPSWTQMLLTGAALPYMLRFCTGLQMPWKNNGLGFEIGSVDRFILNPNESSSSDLPLKIEFEEEQILGANIRIRSKRALSLRAKEFLENQQAFLSLVEAMARNSAKVQNVEDGSLLLDLHFETLLDISKFWVAYSEGKLQEELGSVFAPVFALPSDYKLKTLLYIDPQDYSKAVSQLADREAAQKRPGHVKTASTRPVTTGVTRQAIAQRAVKRLAGVAGRMGVTHPASVVLTIASVAGAFFLPLVTDKIAVWMPAPFYTSCFIFCSAASCVCVLLICLAVEEVSLEYRLGIWASVTVMSWVFSSLDFELNVGITVCQYFLAIGMYRKRWAIRYGAYRFTLWLEQHLYEPYKREHSYMYDGFVVCSPKDRQWVREVMGAALEAKRGLKLFLGSRHKCAHRLYQDVITEAAASSRTLIVVLSPQLFQSRWSFTALDLSARFDNVQLITLKPLPETGTPWPVATMLKQMGNECLIWPDDDPMGQEFFWEKLANTLTKNARPDPFTKSTLPQ